ncbi:uncharacterized protein BCR38DRAFT_410225 [Pseudomassariella vexata]|uniref:Nudix hydrolase domain-containing protein n=1 Tax=Pseudomassariella vexata TaxID=1141098 RepID=A0A1Y2DXD5_9PEZI|nr:uncharacterized protein BCR38DRAFT_410225 [Pseudomassariella vexata]ORY63285.1 hypothetical protein BCR38DRAFT_410225 [Pseudomassariella vexata]
MGPTLTATQKSVLAMSKSQYLSLIQPTHPADSLRVGAAIFRMDLRSSRPTILLLKWSDLMALGPGTFEPPSGRVDDGDWSISDALARAVRKQTGLKVFRVLGMLSEIRQTTEHVWLGPDGTESSVTHETVQLNWTVLVENSDEIVVECQEQDQESVWASWNMLEMLSLTAETRALAKEALEWAGRCLY